MAKVTVDGIEVEVPNGSSVLQACEAAGKEIPRFCYHERLSIAGNCRMCLVEIEKAPPKPISSCTYPVADGMVVHTDSPMVRNGRRGVMEFLLINHPLDCPICDQGGECDLQDQAMGYGMDHSRYAENKRAVQDKNLGPLVKTVMTRCIHCTRCIRFITEVAGVPDLGATSRGEHMEVGTYVEKALGSELSGNIIDLCPVGALTSKPYAFVARPWELSKIDSIDVLDAVGTNIRIDARGPEVLRILPRLNEDVNEEWLADKSRFALDGLRRRRLDRPWVRRNGKLEAASWSEAFAVIAERLHGVPGDRVGALAGDLCDAESMLALKDLMAALGSANLDCRQDGAHLNASRRDFYSFNTSIAGIEDADAILLVGTNPRREAPVLNARIRKHWLHGNIPIGLIGGETDLTYRVQQLGNVPGVLNTLNEDFAKLLRDAKHPMLVLGQAALARPDGAAVLAAAWRLAASVGALTADWHGFNVLHTAAARVGALDLGFVPGRNGKSLTADAGWRRRCAVAARRRRVRHRPHRRRHVRGVPRPSRRRRRGARRRDPAGCRLYRETGHLCEHRGSRAAQPPRRLSARRGTRGLEDPARVQRGGGPHAALRHHRCAARRLEQVNPVFGRVGFLPRFGCTDQSGPSGDPAALSDAPFEPAIANYYQTDPISRASPTMAACTATFAATPLVAAAE